MTGSASVNQNNIDSFAHKQIYLNIYIFLWEHVQLFYLFDPKIP